ncbi:MAG: 1-deoxy-D-xylulose-5-phosphate synthase [Phycisphaerales bacterium]|nr:MAG: 1-deoxy-D-xylulose-5-phosphate synthase [Phycisphaerales bacterium]
MRSILETISGPADLHRYSVDQLKILAGEMRDRIVEAVGKNGGHLASNLGIADLTIALHYVFDFSKDRVLWDVGHQCYPHKLLTGRAERFGTIRKAGGLSGFPDIHESEYDLFSVGHAGTSIATAVGLARGDQMVGRDARVVAVIGDASIVNGLAFEGLNQAGMLKRQFLVVLNDNQWGISPTQGGLAKYLARFRASSLYEEVRAKMRHYVPKMPVLGKPVYDAIEHIKGGIKATVSPHQIFEQLGLMYVGPCDGHDIGHLIELLQLVKDVRQPVLLHVHTQKGCGCEWACAEPGTFHSPRPFTIESGKVTIQRGSGKSWTRAFAEALIALARDNEKVFAMTAAMPSGTGLDRFAKVYPQRFLDCGIAESCTVDMAAGMAKAGLRPVAAIYSTFLQRGFDQVFQEVSLQGLPVVFCLDRAGLVGGDGAVHHGFLDIAYLRGLPGMVLMAPADEPELTAAMKLSLSLDGPSVIRYPRDTVPEPFGEAPAFELGKSRVMREGTDATVLAYGATVAMAMEAAELLAAEGIDLGVVNARFAKPIDRDMVIEALTRGHPVVTVEDHSVSGGFGSAVLEAARELELPADHLTRLGMPADRFIAHGSRAGQLAEVGIDAAGIAATVHQRLGDAPARRPGAEAQRFDRHSSPRSAGSR